MKRIKPNRNKNNRSEINKTKPNQKKPLRNEQTCFRLSDDLVEVLRPLWIPRQQNVGIGSEQILLDRSCAEK